MDRDAKIKLAQGLFAGWSNGRPDGPLPYFSPDAVLQDPAGGTFTGHAAIRGFVETGLAIAADMRFEPEDFWVNADGVAVTWTLTATPGGKPFSLDGMSFLTMRDGLVTHEKDFYDTSPLAAHLASLGDQ